MVFVPDIISIPNSKSELNADIIGNKAYSRVILHQLHLPTPPAIIITSEVFKHFLHYQDGQKKWQEIVQNANPTSPEQMNGVSQELQKLVRRHPFDPKLSDSISQSYHQHLHKNWAHLTVSAAPQTKVPVSYSIPIIKGETALLDFLRQLWSAQLTPHALTLNLISRNQGLIQPPIMISDHQVAITSGTITTIEPITNNKNAVKIEAIYGANPQADKTEIEADIYIVDRKTGMLLSKRQSHQNVEITVDHFGHYKKKKITHQKQFEQKLKSEQIKQLVDAANKIHSHQLGPQVINWFISKSGLYFTRFKPLELEQPSIVKHLKRVNQKQKFIATGLVASPGITTGPIVRINQNTGVLNGKIVVVNQADAQLIRRIKQAAGIIIESGGIDSDIAQAAREIGIPTLVGTKTIPLSDNQVVTLNAIKGEVYQNQASPNQETIIKSMTAPNAPATPAKPSQHTATRIYLYLNQINQESQSIYQQADGVGLLLGNDLVTQFGIHPKRLINNHKKALIDDLTKKITNTAHLFGERPVIYHPIDLSTDVARKLDHGVSYEPTREHNSSFGFRGAYRTIHDPSVFNLELDVIRQLRQKQQIKNLWLCLPLVRDLEELKKIKRIIAAANLYRSPSFKLYAKIGTLSAIDQIPELKAEGVDGFILDLDLLALGLQGYDPSSLEVDQQINLTQPTILNIIRKAIDLSSKNHLPCMATSYQIDHAANTITQLVNTGVAEIIINPPRLDQVKQWLMAAESKLVTKK